MREAESVGMSSEPTSGLRGAGDEPGERRGRAGSSAACVSQWLPGVAAGAVGSAAALAPVSWRVVSLSNTAVQPGGQLTYHLDVANTGDEASDGSAVNLTVRLPVGMTGVSADTSAFAFVGGFDCSAVVGATGTFTCTGTPIVPAEARSGCDVDHGRCGVWVRRVC